jgi:hypothetical protein
MNPYSAYISMKAASDFSDALDLYVVGHDAPLAEHMRAQNRGYIPLHMLRDKGRDSHLVYVHRMSYNPAMHLKAADPVKFQALVRTRLGASSPMGGVPVPTPPAAAPRPVAAPGPVAGPPVGVPAVPVNPAQPGV